MAARHTKGKNGMVKRATKEKKMTPTAETSTTKKIEVSRKVFNLDTLQKEDLKGTVEFAPVTNLAEALSKVGGDQSKLIGALNKSFEREARFEGKKSLTSDNPNVIANVKVLMDFLRPLRPILAPGENDRGKQNAILFAWLKQEANAKVLEGLKAQALASEDDSEDETETEEK